MKSVGRVVKTNEKTNTGDNEDKPEDKTDAVSSVSEIPTKDNSQEEEEFDPPDFTSQHANHTQTPKQKIDESDDSEQDSLCVTENSENEYSGADDPNYPDSLEKKSCVLKEDVDLFNALEATKNTIPPPWMFINDPIALEVVKDALEMFDGELVYDE